MMPTIYLDRTEKNGDVTVIATRAVLINNPLDGHGPAPVVRLKVSADHYVYLNIVEADRLYKALIELFEHSMMLSP